MIQWPQKTTAKSKKRLNKCRERAWGIRGWFVVVELGGSVSWNTLVLQRKRLFIGYPDNPPARHGESKTNHFRVLHKYQTLQLDHEMNMFRHSIPIEYS